MLVADIIVLVMHVHTNVKTPKHFWYPTDPCTLETTSAVLTGHFSCCVQDDSELHEFRFIDVVNAVGRL